MHEYLLIKTQIKYILRMNSVLHAQLCLLHIQFFIGTVWYHSQDLTLIKRRGMTSQENYLQDFQVSISKYESHISESCNTPRDIVICTEMCV